MKLRILKLTIVAAAVALLAPVTLRAQDMYGFGFGGFQPLHSGTMMTFPPVAPAYEPLVGTATPESIRQDGELWAAPPSRDLPWQSTWPSYSSSLTVGRITALEPYPRDSQQQTQTPTAPGAPNAPTTTAQPPSPPLIGPPLPSVSPRPQSRVMQFNPQTGSLEDARNIRRW